MYCLKTNEYQKLGDTDQKTNKNYNKKKLLVIYIIYYADEEAD